MQPTNNAVRRDASPLECSGDFRHGLLAPWDFQVEDIEDLLYRNGFTSGVGSGQRSAGAQGAVTSGRI